MLGQPGSTAQELGAASRPLPNCSSSGTVLIVKKFFLILDQSPSPVIFYHQVLV